jgi:hypothetical protein
MRRPLRHLAVVLICLVGLAGSDFVGGGFNCDINAARAMYGKQADLGAFFAFYFDIPSKTGGIGNKFRNWFKAESATVAKKKLAKFGVSLYKAILQSTFSTGLSIPKKKGKDKRATITALQDGVNGVVQSVQVSSGVFDARVTVAVDKTEGLVSGQSLAGFELQRPAGADPLEFTSIVAAYTEDEGGDFLGFVVQAFDDVSGALDVAQLFETAEIELRIQQTDTQLITFARDAPSGGPDPLVEEGSGWTVVSTQEIPVPDDPFTLGFGASNLDKKGTFYFDFFHFGDQVPGPELEGELFGELILAILDLGDARDALDSDLPDTALAEEELGEARGKIADVQADLAEAMEADTLSDETEGKIAAKVLKRTLKGADRVLKTLQKGKSKKPSKLAKPVQKVIDDVSVVMANLGGMKTTNARQLTFLPPPVVEDQGGGGGGACTNPAPSGGEFATATHDGDAWEATTLKARELEDGRFDIQFEDCTGEGSYLLLAFTFPGDPTVGVYNIAPFGSITGFAKNIKNPNAFGILFGGTLEITAYDPKTETLEGTFSADDLFDGDDALVGGSFRIEDFD